MYENLTIEVLEKKSLPTFVKLLKSYNVNNLDFKEN